MSHDLVFHTFTMSDHSQESRMPKERHEVESDTSSVDKTFGVSKVEAALKVW